jgi:pyrroline-5-carboxylate reductase
VVVRAMPNTPAATGGITVAVAARNAGAPRSARSPTRCRATGSVEWTHDEN